MNQSPSIKTMFVLPFVGLDFPKLIGEAMEEKSDEILDLNRQQLDRGLDMKGNSLGKYANFKYKNRYQPVDLKKTGDYRNKKTLTAGTNAAEMFSQDSKAPMLEKRYGKDIEGIPSSAKPNVAELIKPVIGEKIKKKQFKNV